MIKTIDGVHAPHVANYFLDKADSENSPITMLKLMKMVYIAQGWCLAILNYDVLKENIEAWRYGPVIPSLYHEFKSNGPNPISERATFFDLEKENDSYFIDLDIAEIPSCTDSELFELLDEVWHMYKKYNGGELIELTHQRGTPWDKAYEPDMNNVIPVEDIRDHYIEKNKN